jgi:hypothetical protein
MIGSGRLRRLSCSVLNGVSAAIFEISMGTGIEENDMR